MSDIVIPEEAVRSVAERMLQRYSQEYENDFTWETFADDARSDLEAALPALRAWRTEIGTRYGYELGRSDTTSEIAELIRKRRDKCEVRSAAWEHYDDAMRAAQQLGRQS